MNYEIKITEIDAWLIARPFVGEPPEAFTTRQESLKGKFYLWVTQLDVKRQKQSFYQSPHYTREEGNVVAFQKVFNLMGGSLLAHEERMAKEQTII
jgi:hypothetical protein